MPSGIYNLKQLNQALLDGAWSNQKPVNVDYLVVAGGGGGGTSNGSNITGGGGAGGLLQGNVPITTNTSITVTVGGGGSAEANGSNSVFGSITAIGGGAATKSNPSNSGGSGGGGTVSGIAYSGGQGTSGQGNAGGTSFGTTTGSGGGGVGTVGLNGIVNVVGGNGGAGIASDISGIRTTYAGGGGGGARSDFTAGAGGAGGGGAGALGNNVTATAGTANTGGGGGGNGQLSGVGTGGTGGAGGSGIVIISYPDIYQAAASTTGSPTISTSGSGSISFDGSTQWAVYPSNAAFTLGSTFTIEAWVYATSLTAGSRRICQSDAGFDLSVASNGTVLFNAATTTSTVSLNTWTHIAFVCNSGTSTLYIDGVASGYTGTNTGVNVTGTSSLTVGTYQTNSGFVWSGYITNFRILKGTALVPPTGGPTAPLTAITNTSILLNAMSGGFLADSSSNGFATTTSSANSPTWNSASPFATGLGYKNRVYKWTSSGSITF